MGSRGPTRKPGSVRWNRELRKKQQLNGISAASDIAKKNRTVSPKDLKATLPTCPECLPKPVQEAWAGLVMDAMAAGVEVKQFDSRGFVIAAGQEVDLFALESLECEGELLLSVIGRKEQIRKSLLQSLVAIGGTPLARLRARITPEEEPKQDDDPWSNL